MRHLGVELLWLQELVHMCKMKVEKVSGAADVADALTKFHGINKPEALCRPYGIVRR